MKRFLFVPDDGKWLILLRLGMGLAVVTYAVSLRNDWMNLMGLPGKAWIGRPVSEAILSLESPLIPRLGWVVALGRFFGGREEAMLSVVWWLLLCSGLALMANTWTRISSILAWFLHLSAAKSAGLFSYGADHFMTIGLFYCMLSSGFSTSWAWRARVRSRLGSEACIVGFFRRALQLHLTLVYFFSGVSKCLGRDWWNGANLWRALVRPTTNVIPPELLSHAAFLLPAAGVLVVFLETSYPFFVWPSATRRPWLMAICLMHLMIGLLMGMALFALVMITLNVSAFGPESFARQKENSGAPEENGEVIAPTA